MDKIRRTQIQKKSSHKLLYTILIILLCIAMLFLGYFAAEIGNLLMHM